MDRARQRHNAMPAIWPLAKFATGECGPIEIILSDSNRLGGFPER